MADDFAKAVEDGPKLLKCLYFGKDRPATPPKVPSLMDKSGEAEMFLPKSPTVYAVISNPKIVDNPDILSYQPHVHGRCDPPALIPLQMNAVELDIAFVTVFGTWRVHCVMGSKSCDCRIAVPMGDQGSILGVEAEVSGKSYRTQLIALGENDDAGKLASVETGSFLKPNIFILTLPQIDGGSLWKDCVLFLAKRNPAKTKQARRTKRSKLRQKRSRLRKIIKKKRKETKRRRPTYFRGLTYGK